MQHNCPYCNAEIPLEALQVNWFESACCNKVVVCSDWSEPAFALRCATDAFLLEHNMVTGNNHQAENPLRMNPRKTEPRWAHVYSSGPFWFVRIIPPTDLREHGRGHGVALANKYTTKAEANVFADSMENYFCAAEKNLKEADGNE